MKSLPRRLATAALILLQWALVIWGAFLIVLALHAYSVEASYFATLPKATAGQDYYVPPLLQGLVTSAAAGPICMGIGAALFYLRGIFLHRQEGPVQAQTFR